MESAYNNDAKVAIWLRRSENEVVTVPIATVRV
jgi:hypothetical protein